MAIAIGGILGVVVAGVVIWRHLFSARLHDAMRAVDLGPYERTETNGNTS